jgi:hypothetical protein
MMQCLSAMSRVQPLLAYRSHMFYGPLPLSMPGTDASSPHNNSTGSPFHLYPYRFDIRHCFLPDTLRYVVARTGYGRSVSFRAFFRRCCAFCMHTKYPGSYTGLHWLKRSFCVWIPVWSVNRHSRLVILSQQAPAFGLGMAYLVFCFGGIIGLWRSCVLFCFVRKGHLYNPHTMGYLLQSSVARLWYANYANCASASVTIQNPYRHEPCPCPTAETSHPPTGETHQTIAWRTPAGVLSETGNSHYWKYPNFTLATIRLTTFINDPQPSLRLGFQPRSRLSSPKRVSAEISWG